MTRVLVCGGRDYQNSRTFLDVMAAIHVRHEVTAIIEGGATGADQMARVWAQMKEIPVETFEADWKTHGRRAGPRRNQKMIDAGKPGLVVAFPGGNGTKDMVSRAKAAGLKVIEVPA